MLAADAMENANSLGKSRQLTAARAELAQAISRIKNSPSANQALCLQLVIGTHNLLSTELEDLEEARNRIVDESTYVNSGSKYMSSHTMSHYYQRCSHTTPIYSTNVKNDYVDDYCSGVGNQLEED